LFKNKKDYEITNALIIAI